jgi:hypothetical protein
MNPKLAGVTEEGTRGAGNVAGAGRARIFGARIWMDVAREDEGRRGRNIGGLESKVLQS